MLACRWAALAISGIGLAACDYEAYAVSTAPPAYTIQELGLLTGGTESQATAGSAAAVVGWATDAGGAPHAAQFAGGSVSRFEEPAGAEASQATGVNTEGSVVGVATLVTGTEAVTWPSVNDAPIVLPGLGGSSARATAINDGGVVLGAAETSGGDTVLVLWRQAPGGYTVTPLASVPTGDAPVGINSRMEVAINGGLAGFLWSADTVLAIAVPNARATDACGLNDLGVVVGGFVATTGLARAFLYTAALGAFPLGAPPGAYTDLVANAVNDSGRVAGTAFTVDGTGNRLSSVPVVGTVLDSVHTFTLLPTLGGARAEPSDNAITGCGMVLGWATSLADTARRAVAWVPVGCTLP